MSSVQFLGISLIPGKISQFFRRLVLDTIATREQEGIVRPDLLQLLIQAKKGTLHEENSAEDHKGPKISKLLHLHLMCSVVQFRRIVHPRDILKIPLK
jgi:hypothetical protein